jgi:hypothetical protein
MSRVSAHRGLPRYVVKSLVVFSSTLMPTFQGSDAMHSTRRRSRGSRSGGRRRPAGAHASIARQPSTFARLNSEAKPAWLRPREFASFVVSFPRPTRGDDQMLAMTQPSRHRDVEARA